MGAGVRERGVTMDDVKLEKVGVWMVCPKCKGAGVVGWWTGADGVARLEWCEACERLGRIAAEAWCARGSWEREGGS